MQQLLQWWALFQLVAVLPVCAAVWLLWMRYRDGRIAGGWRSAFVALCILASWYVAMAFVYVAGGQHVGAVMLTVLWAIGGLSWAVSALSAWRAGERCEQYDANAPADGAFAQAMARKRRSYAMYTRAI